MGENCSNPFTCCWDLCYYYHCEKAQTTSTHLVPIWLRIPYTHTQSFVYFCQTGKKKKLFYFPLTFSQLASVSIFCHSFDVNSFTMCQQLNSVCSFMTIMKFPFTYHYSQSCGENSRDALVTPNSMTLHSRLKCQLRLQHSCINYLGRLFKKNYK